MVNILPWTFLQSDSCVSYGKNGQHLSHCAAAWRLCLSRRWTWNPHDIIMSCLVVGTPTPLKNDGVSNSWDDFPFPTEWKNNPNVPNHQPEHIPGPSKYLKHGVSHIPIIPPRLLGTAMKLWVLERSTPWATALFNSPAPIGSRCNGSPSHWKGFSAQGENGIGREGSRNGSAAIFSVSLEQTTWMNQLYERAWVCQDSQKIWTYRVRTRIV